MKLAASGSRGVFWRANARGTQERRLGEGRREQGDWWIRWACPHGHLHRAQIGPKALAQRESERRRIERPCPLRQLRPTRFLLADVIRDYLTSVEGRKRSYKDDRRYGHAWSERFAGRTLDEITPAELEKIRTERLKTPPSPTGGKQTPQEGHLTRDCESRVRVPEARPQHRRPRREDGFESCRQAANAPGVQWARALPVRRRGGALDEGAPD